MKKTFFMALNKSQVADLCAFAENPQGLHELPTGALLFLYKVLCRHTVPHGDTLTQRIFALFRSRLDADPKKIIAPLLTQNHAICISRFHASSVERKGIDPTFTFIPLPEDLVDRLYRLAYPKGNIAFQLKSGRPSDSVKLLLTVITKRAAELERIDKHHQENTDPTLSLIRTMCALGSDIYALLFEQSLATALAAVSDRAPLEKAGKVLCKVIVTRYPTQIAKFHNHELFAAIAGLGKTAANSQAMRLYKNYFLTVLEKRYEADDTNALIMTLFSAFGAARVLMQIRSPDFEDVAHAAYRCCIRHEAMLAKENWAQVTLVRMISVAKTLATNEVLAITMKILSLPSVLEIIRRECDTPLVLALTDLVVAQVFSKKSTSAEAIRGALIYRLRDLTQPDQRVKHAPEALCAILNMVMRSESPSRHAAAWKRARDMLLAEEDSYFHALSQPLLTSLVTFASYDVEIETSPASAALWAKLAMVVTQRQRSSRLALQNIAFMYGVAAKEIRADRAALRTALLVAIIMRLRVFVSEAECNQFGTDFGDVPFFKLTGARSALLRFLLALSKVIEKGTSAITPRELQMTVLSMQFSRRAVHRSFALHMGSEVEVQSSADLVDTAFGISDDKKRCMYASDVDSYDAINRKLRPSTKDWCKYVTSYGLIMQAKAPLARCLKTCGEDRVILQFAFKKIWEDRAFLLYTASAERCEGIRQALQAMGKHWAPQLWDYIASGNR